MGVLLMLLFELTTTAQDYNIKFGATGVTVVKVDSVLVENINQGFKLTLPGNETLHLGALGLENSGINQETIKVYPNPMQGIARLSFYAKTSGNSKLQIYDPNGRVVAETNTLLQEGMQFFQISDLTQGMYVIHITGNNYSYTTKVISEFYTNNEPALTFVQTEKTKSSQQVNASTNIKFNMTYSTGDKLRFTGFSGNYTEKKFDIPTNSKTIVFAFTEPKSINTPVWSCGANLSISHLAVNGVAPVDKQVTYGTVTNIPGESAKCWITSNLGADHQANAPDDATEESGGWYWQFNLMQGYKHTGTTRTPNTTWITSINQNSEWTSDNDPCSRELPEGWRLPTTTEWSDVMDGGSWVDWSGPWNSDLKIHSAGYIPYSWPYLMARGSQGNYWSSSQVDNTRGYGIIFDYVPYGYFFIDYANKAYAFPVRCIRDECSLVTADAGEDQSVCNTTTTLAANNPTLGSGEWTVISGTGGSFGNNTAYNSSFSGNAGSSYTLRWTVSYPPCDDVYDEVVISFISPPTTANAGVDQTVCGSSTTLSGNNPSVGTGQWTIISGSGGSFGNNTAYNSSFSGTAETSYVLRWTISHPPCADSYDEVTITFKSQPTTSNAGPDQTVCGTSTTLAGNNPSIGTGNWTILKGTGGSFGNASVYNTTFSGTAETSYILRWTISNPPCSDSYDDVTIAFKSQPTTANAGTDQTVCGTTTTLAGNNPTIGTGQWTIINGTGGSFGNPNAYNSSFTGTTGVVYTLRWTISNPPCNDSYDDVSVKLIAPPTPANAGLDQRVHGTYTTLAGNNPTIGTGHWTIISGAGGYLGNPNAYNSSFSGSTGVLYTLRWTISNPPCSPSSDDVNVLFY